MVSFQPIWDISSQSRSIHPFQTSKGYLRWVRDSLNLFSSHFHSFPSFALDFLLSFIFISLSIPFLSLVSRLTQCPLYYLLLRVPNLNPPNLPLGLTARIVSAPLVVTTFLFRLRPTLAGRYIYLMKKKVQKTIQKRTCWSLDLENDLIPQHNLQLLDPRSAQPISKSQPSKPRSRESILVLLLPKEKVPGQQ